jgi:phage shock protein PspC (stress-responsive transcriptional regulator)
MHRKPLRRSRRDRILAGVCGGIAESYGWHPTTVRVLWVLLGLLPVIPGTVLYLALWILVPQEE